MTTSIHDTRAPRRSKDLSRRLIVIGTMLAGAGTGALLVPDVSPVSALAPSSALLVPDVSPVSALAPSTVLLMILAAGAALAARRPATWRAVLG